jgi:hypothetical protein
MVIRSSYVPSSKRARHQSPGVAVSMLCDRAMQLVPEPRAHPTCTSPFFIATMRLSKADLSLISFTLVRQGLLLRAIAGISG